MQCSVLEWISQCKRFKDFKESGTMSHFGVKALDTRVLRGLLEGFGRIVASRFKG